MCYNRVRIFACGHQTTQVDYCNRLLNARRSRGNYRATCSVIDDVAHMRLPCPTCSARPLGGRRLPSFVLPSLERRSRSPPPRRRESSLGSRLNRLNLGGPGPGSGSDSDGPRLQFGRMRLNSDSGSDGDGRFRGRRGGAPSPPPRRFHRGRRSNVSPMGPPVRHFGRSRSPDLDRNSDPYFNRYRSPMRRQQSPYLFREDFDFGPRRYGGGRGRGGSSGYDGGNDSGSSSG